MTRLPLAPRLRVLVIDDSLDYLRSMVLRLRSIGHYANFAINATAAIDVARCFRPDIVMLDVGLPDGDGRLLAGLLRSEAGLSEATSSASPVACTRIRADRSRLVATRITSSRWIPPRFDACSRAK